MHFICKRPRDSPLYDLFDRNTVSLSVAFVIYFLSIRLFHLTMPLFWLWFLALVVHLQNNDSDRFMPIHETKHHYTIQLKSKERMDPSRKTFLWSLSIWNTI
mmetsp:Transcript_17586/g.43879  ORF Transcript_17586/g.43879 Transcript_17586/m.43879 type:complete len:102 (+) Transcript_17586:1241-1546(+)